MITGTNANDKLIGTDLDDAIDGLKGADVMTGLKGDDTYTVDNTHDQIVENFNEGDDRVVASVNYILATNVEGLTLVDNAISGTGNDQDNHLTGNHKNNILDGGIGADRLAGGAGNDTYIVDNANDLVIENPGEGRDLVKSSADYILPGEVEDLVLTGAAGLRGTGNLHDNVITGNAGENTLDGMAGADTLIGGKGDDTYYVEDLGDKVVESANQGTDTVYAEIDFTLAANVENLVMSGGASTGTGNALKNQITGNDFDNIIDGGKGADVMAGGNGDDGYVVDNVGDKVIETDTGGLHDGIETSISLKLPDYVENLQLAPGSAALNGTGNELDNTIFGNDGRNVIDGGAGKDYMRGGKGDDTYFVDDFNDKVVESPGGGTDTVVSTISYVLGTEVEKLALSGSGNNFATGNDLDNVLTGNDGDNMLTGGLGKDTMSGGKGSDVYLVDNAGDKVVESVTNANGGGHDAVYSSIDFSLAALANVEDLYLNGAATHATGNALDNIIQGTLGDDVIDGGKGADVMAGFDGGDTYYVDNIGDKVQENGTVGADAIFSTVALSDAVANVENYHFKTSGPVSFIGNDLNNAIGGGSGKDALAGGNGDDTLMGNSGDDTLRGGSGNDDLNGGTGADQLIGGDGNDTYFIDNGKDKVEETSTGGHDGVNSSVSLADLFEGVEDGWLSGAAGLTLGGNGLDNHLYGNTGNNTLNGKDGSDELWGYRGNDTLIGGNGADTFGFDFDPMGAKNDGHDTIKDFVKAEDVLVFDNVSDESQDGTIDLTDLLDSVSKVVDYGAGQNVDVTFDNGAVITFAGLGTATHQIDQLTDLVASTTQIHVQG